MRHKYSVEVFEERSIRDRLVGRARVNENVENDTRTLELELTDGDGKAAGTVNLVFQSYDDPLYL